MITDIVPVKMLQGQLKVPGDKSISHRALIMGSLAQGKSRVTGFLPSADCLNTLNCLQQLGVNLEISSPTSIEISGVGLYGLTEPLSILNAGNSGTTARLFLGLLSGQKFFSIMIGDNSLSTRPMNRVVDPLRKMGATISGRQNGNLLPLAITGSKLTGICFESAVASAQLKSSLLLAGLFAESATSISEPTTSRDHTERMLEYFGVSLEKKNFSTIITPGQTLHARDVVVPGDFSSAAFFIVGALITPNSDLVIQNVGINPTRIGLLHVLKDMGAKIELCRQHSFSGEPVADIHVKHSELKGVTIQGDIIPTLIDEIPILAVAALFAVGDTIIRDAAELRIKETDRIAALVSQLTNIGGSVAELADGLVIHGNRPLEGGYCNSLHDHRIAMALAIAGLQARNKIQIDNSECVAISYPDFFKELQQITVI